MSKSVRRRVAQTKARNSRPAHTVTRKSASRAGKYKRHTRHISVDTRMLTPGSTNPRYHAAPQYPSAHDGIDQTHAPQTDRRY